MARQCVAAALDCSGAAGGSRAGRTALALGRGLRGRGGLRVRSLCGFCVIDDLLDLHHSYRLSVQRFFPSLVASRLATIENFPCLVFITHYSTTSEETAFSVAIFLMFPIRPRAWSFSSEAKYKPRAP